MKKDNYTTIGTLWVPVKDNEEYYDIDLETGKVRAHYVTTFTRPTSKNPVHYPCRRMLKGTVMGRGYTQVMLSKGKRRHQNDGKFRYVHDLVAEIVWEKPVEQEYFTKHARKVQVYHLDGDKTNNAWWNLAWRVVLGEGDGVWYPPRTMTANFKAIYESIMKKGGAQ